MYWKKAVPIFSVIAVVLMLVSNVPCTAADSEGEYSVSVISAHGKVVDVSTGQVFESGTPISDRLDLTFIANPGHEFLRWEITGACTAEPNGVTLAIYSLKDDVTITVVTRNYSTSQELLTVVDSYGTPVPGDTLINSWAFSSVNLDRTGSMWSGMPCTPLIVGDVVYVRAGGILYALDINNGTILHHVDSNGSSVSYYHYISYGAGVIFDTVEHKAYDLELNFLYDIPTKLVYAQYHDGYFYGCLSGSSSVYYSMFKTSTDKNSDLADGVKINLFNDRTEYRIYAQYGQFSNVIFENGYFFFLQADSFVGSSGWRAMTAVNLETEKSYTVELTGFTGMPWDDGWLSYYNGYFYLTAYTAGLFGGVLSGLESKRSSVMWAKFDFDTGKFEEPRYEEITTPEGLTFKGIASGLEIDDGRGYIVVRHLGTDTLGGSDDAGTYLIAFDIADDGRPIPKGKASSPMSHGGIVVNTAYDSDGKRYIYLLPYNSSDQGLYVFTDELVDGVWTLNEKYAKMEFDKSMNQYSSQAVRMGPDGELVFYLDSGYLQCYKAADRYGFTILAVNDGTATVQSVRGKDIATVLGNLYPGSTLENGKMLVGQKTYTIYGLDTMTWSYDQLSDISITNKFSSTEYLATISAPYSYIAIVEEGCNAHFRTTGDEGWYCFGDTGIVKCNLRDYTSLDDVVGLTLTYYTEKPGHAVVYQLDGETVFTDWYKEGSQVTLRGQVEKTGYTVSDWSSVDILISDGKFIMPDSDVTLTAVSVINTYTVTYLVDGEKVGDIEKYSYGTAVIVRAKYSEVATAWSSPYVSLVSGTFLMPARDLEIVAVTSVDAHTITYYLNGEVYRSVVALAGDRCIVLQKAESESAVTGWASDTVSVTDGIFEMPSADVAFYAVTVPTHLELEYETSETFDVPPGYVLDVAEESIISVILNERSLEFKGLKVGSTLLTLTVAGERYDVSMAVVPHTYIDDNGNTVTESLMQSADGSEITTTREHTVVSGENGIDSTGTKTVTVTDSEGNLVSSTVIDTVVKDKDPDYAYTTLGRNLLAHTESVHTIVSSSAGTSSDVLVFTQTYTTWSDNGLATAVTVVTTADNLSETSVTTTTYSTSYSSFTVVEKKTVNQDGNVSTDKGIQSKKGNFDVEVSDGAAIVDVTDDASGLDAVLNYLAADDTVSSVEVKATDTVSESTLASVLNNNAKLTLISGGSNIALSSESVAELSGKGDLSFSVKDNATLLSNKMKEAAADAEVFSITLICGAEEQHAFGSFSISLACNIEVQQGKDLKVWRIDANGDRVFAKNVQYSEGKVSFDADHLSYYAVGYLEAQVADDGSGSDTGLTTIIVVAVIILAALIAVLYLRSRKRFGGSD